MKHEKLIRGIGEVDDRILERYHDIDTRLARKHAKKAMALRMTAIAACMAVLLCACLPLSMMTHPIGRAVLGGDSETLLTELMKIDGFLSWQGEAAEKLEENLPAPMWDLLQTTPVLDVLTQPQFKGMTPMDSFADGEPYRLYFLSNGDGTCTLKYITTNPAYEGNFTIEIPQTSPAGDTVTAIDVDQPKRRVKGQIPDFPYVLTPAFMDALAATAMENKISAFDLDKLRAYYLKLSVTGLDEQEYQGMTDAFPITAVSDVYVFDANASMSELNAIYARLTEYCEWDTEKYEQSVKEIMKLAKKDGDREKAELNLTVLREVDLGKITGMTIPATVTSISQKLWTCLPALQTITVDAEHASLQMIDGCLMDTETGTLKLYLREDGKFPADADIRVLDSYAFSLYTLQTNADEEAELYIPESVTEIRKDALEDLSAEDGVFTIHVYLPAGLTFFGGMTSEHDYCRVIYHYPGTMAEWEKDVTLGMVDWECSILLLTSDIDEPTVFHFPRRFS
ncbi:MAG: hypothetical protein IIU63_05395 [Clostridia bacterium]|nr:hypothetical protein [Clostridia bacterium]